MYEFGFVALFLIFFGVGFLMLHRRLEEIRDLLTEMKGQARKE